MEIPKKIAKEIEDFCILNEITDQEQFIFSMLKTGFNVKKYGNAPWKQEIEKKVFITDDEKMKELTEELDHLRDRITTKEQEIINNASNMKSLNNDIEDKKKEITNLSDKLKQLNKVLEEKKKSSPDTLGDIYGEDGGFWGSNLMDKK